jgi:hypothetical protein
VAETWMEEARELVGKTGLFEEAHTCCRDLRRKHQLFHRRVYSWKLACLIKYGAVLEYLVISKYDGLDSNFEMPLECGARELTFLRALSHTGDSRVTTRKF